MRFNRDEYNNFNDVTFLSTTGSNLIRFSEKKHSTYNCKVSFEVSRDSRD